MSVNQIKYFMGSYSTFSLFRREKIWHQGTDLISPAIHQVHMLGILFFYCTLCLKGKDWRILKNPIIKATSRTQTLLQFSPLLIAIGAKFLPKREYPKTQYALETLSYQAGNIILTLNTVAIIILGFQGKRKLFLVSLSGYLVSRITNSDNIPYKMRENLKKTMVFFQTTLDLVSPTSQLIRVLTIIEIIFRNLSSYSSYLFGQFGECSATGNTNLTLKTLQQAHKHHLVINAEHLKHPPQKGYNNQPPSAKELLSIMDRLEQALLTIDFENYKTPLCLMVADDQHWLSESWTHQSSKTDNEILFMKEGVHIFLNRLKRQLSASTSSISLKVRKYVAEDINLSNPESLKQVHLMLQYWDQQPDKTEETTAHLLMQLGINGANYCGPRIRDLTSSISKSLGVPTSLFCLLRELQIAIIRRYATEILKNNPAFQSELNRELYGEQTPHFFNKFLFFFGAPLGINTNGLIDDETLSESQAILLRLMMVSTIRNYNRQFHTQDYTVDHLFKEVRKAFDSARLDVKEVYQEFLQENIQDLNLAFELDEEDNTKMTDLGIYFYLIKNKVLMQSQKVK